LTRELREGSVRGLLHEVPGARDALVLTHGAGGNCEMPLLVRVAEAFTAAGVTVLRCDLPFRQARPKGTPYPAQAAADRAGLHDASRLIRRLVNGRVWLGGQSYGGRQASMLAAEQPDAADALLLLSYPLHPPGKPEQKRTGHFGDLRLPTLFVHGTRDPFGTIEELKAAMPANARLEIVEGAGHDLSRGKFEIDRLVVEPFLRLNRDI
jgi:predicted alpha/beta-hydrolase family hydrolase